MQMKFCTEDLETRSFGMPRCMSVVYNMHIFFNSQYVTNVVKIRFILIMSHKKVVDFSRI
jgi:hypothetical protein